ncbi:hypothetical protein [Shewanella ulleungensis]|uniref:Uncharacterized protein n=1 Tax=Shewanella ulleungensis TaxID=2282699 RepID=A0ABQ2QSE8_9GAMM|nr:hypothetical protein [Shewanella ulleungensis]MCL1150766.1 hypothetical protein [Shewanella ulleungensis]GGP93760.1 hypothetical protein GCM10009410_29720 [Shewanella ulleungensis]
MKSTDPRESGLVHWLSLVVALSIAQSIFWYLDIDVEISLTIEYIGTLIVKSSLIALLYAKEKSWSAIKVKSKQLKL